MISFMKHVTTHNHIIEIIASFDIRSYCTKAAVQFFEKDAFYFNTD